MDINCCSSRYEFTSPDKPIELTTPTSQCKDVLSEFLLRTVQRLLQNVLESEVDEFISQYHHLADEQGRRPCVRNGYVPARLIRTELGNFTVYAPRVRDLRRKLTFSSRLLPPYRRKLNCFDQLARRLLLAGLRSGNLLPALQRVLGRQSEYLEKGILDRLELIWQRDHARWHVRTLKPSHYSYLWVYGRSFDDPDSSVLLVLGVTTSGVNELLSIAENTTSSVENWAALLEEMKRRGLTILPPIVMADQLSGFEQAAYKVYP